MQKRSAFTLFELVLVLAIILVVSAISIPSFQGMMEDQRVTESGDMVRSAFSEARVHAITDGVAYRFSAVGGTGQWRIASDSDAAWQGDGTATAPDGSGLFEQRGTLSKGIRFNFSDNPGPAPADTGNTNDAAVTDFVRLIVFYPDGAMQCYKPDGSSADDYWEMSLGGNNANHSLILSVRPLTGNVKTRWSNQNVNSR